MELASNWSMARESIIKNESVLKIVLEIFSGYPVLHEAIKVIVIKPLLML